MVKKTYEVKIFLEFPGGRKLSSCFLKRDVLYYKNTIPVRVRGARGSGRNFASGQRAGNFGYPNRTPALAKRETPENRIYTPAGVMKW